MWCHQSWATQVSWESANKWWTRLRSKDSRDRVICSLTALSSSMMYCSPLVCSLSFSRVLRWRRHFRWGRKCIRSQPNSVPGKMWTSNAFTTKYSHANGTTFASRGSCGTKSRSIRSRWSRCWRSGPPWAVLGKLYWRHSRTSNLKYKSDQDT